LDDFTEMKALNTTDGNLESLFFFREKWLYRSKKNLQKPKPRIELPIWAELLLFRT
jgi:hypothetical protein